MYVEYVGTLKTRFLLGLLTIPFTQEHSHSHSSLSLWGGHGRRVGKGEDSRKLSFVSCPYLSQWIHISNDISPALKWRAPYTFYETLHRDHTVALFHPQNLIKYTVHFMSQYEASTPGLWCVCVGGVYTYIKCQLNVTLSNRAQALSLRPSCHHCNKP